MPVRINTISWKVLQSGQIAAYKDSIYEYEIESNLPESGVELFCTKFLRPSAHKGSCFTGSCSFPFGLSSYYRFTKLADNKYNYIVCSPYTG